jgi:hypothetical protein
MFKKIPHLDYFIAIFIFGIILGSWITVSFYNTLYITEPAITFAYDLQYDEEVEARIEELKEKYDKENVKKR